MEQIAIKSFLFHVGLFLTSFILLSHASVQAKTVVYPLVSNPTEELVLELLKLGLSESPSGTPYHLQAMEVEVNEPRKIAMLKEGELDILWLGTQRQHEQDMFPVRIPILKGMLGHRIFIIRQGEQHRFNNISSFERLKDVPLGQGKYWGDTVVLKHNGMTVVDPVKYESLFHMLEGGRFDFFPRALHEPWSEVTSRAQLNLTVEQNHLLIYPFSLYFFTANNNQAFAQDLHAGLISAIENGSYDDMFYNHPIIRETLRKTQLKGRIVHRLNNPNMSDLTPVDDTRLWLDIENF